MLKVVCPMDRFVSGSDLRARGACWGWWRTRLTRECSKRTLDGKCFICSLCSNVSFSTCHTFYIVHWMCLMAQRPDVTTRAPLILYIGLQRTDLFVREAGTGPTKATVVRLYAIVGTSPLTLSWRQVSFANKYLLVSQLRIERERCKIWL